MAFRPLPSSPLVRRRNGFTLIELLVVIAIIAILMALLVPAVQKVRSSAARAQCCNNLRQMGVAFHNYYGTRKKFPPGYTATGPYVDGGTDTTPGWAWGTYLLPYLEQAELFNQFDLTKPVQNYPGIQTMVPVFICPADLVTGPFAVTDKSFNPLVTAAPSCYAGCCGSGVSTTAATGNGILYRNSAIRIANILDGTSQTILVEERAWSNVMGVWCGAINNGYCNQGPTNPAAVPGKIGQAAGDLVLIHSGTVNAPTGRALDDCTSKHVSGANFLLADGSVHFILNISSGDPNSVDFQAMGTIAGGEVLTKNLFE